MKLYAHYLDYLDEFSIEQDFLSRKNTFFFKLKLNLKVLRVKLLNFQSRPKTTDHISFLILLS